MQFVYLVRTQNELQKGALELGLKKVLKNEYPDLAVKFTQETAKVGDKIMAHCIALSQASKIKSHSYPNVKYIVFDEYMIEEGQGNRYVNGWKEPDLLLSIYHTIDREEDRVIAFLLGNNTQFYNPYHMHKAFNIPPIEQGEIWTSENVLYQWAVPSTELQTKKDSSKFIRMVEGTDYDIYANKGMYVGDNYNMIRSRTDRAQCQCVLNINGLLVGIWIDIEGGFIIISDRYNLSVNSKYSLGVKEIKDGWPLFRTCGLYKFYQDLFRRGLIYFDSMEIKQYCEPLINSFMKGR